MSLIKGKNSLLALLAGIIVGLPSTTVGFGANVSKNTHQATNPQRPQKPNCSSPSAKKPFYESPRPTAPKPAPRFDAADYINQLIKSLEISLQSYLSSQETAEFGPRLSLIIKMQLDEYKATHQINAAEEKDLIDNMIGGAVLFYIMSKSFQYALEKTGDRDLSVRVAESMFANALAIIEKKTYFDPADIIQFIGKAGEEAVRIMIQEFAAQAYTTTNTGDHYFQAKECCVCYEDFSATTPRVLLSPCNHALCASCADEWFFKDTPSKNHTCPMCRGTVDLKKLARDIEAALA